MNWTISQKNAIEMSRRDALIAAAAGSGKTAVLTERVIDEICTGKADISRLLIVTFTEKAADELKIRIRDRLEKKSKDDPDDRAVKRQLSLLPSASISTIHSFYIKVLREGFSLLGLPPKLRVAEEGAAEIIRRRVLNGVIDGYYNENKNDGYDIENAEEFFDTFEKLRPGEKLYNVFCDLYDTVTSYPEFIDFYKRCETECERYANDFTKSPQFQYFVERTKARLSVHKADFMRLFDEYDDDPDFVNCYRPVSEYCVSLINDAMTALDGRDYDGLYTFFSAKPAYPRSKPVKGEKEFKEVQKALKTSFGKTWDKAAEFLSFNKEDVSRICRKTSWLCGCIYKLLSRFEAEFSAEKLESGIMDFNDMERFAHRLICENSGFAEKTASKYDEIYVDEYQDVNRVQDAIFAAISKNNRFMVGDVKQSIYSFRGSDPTVFSAYRERFAPYNAKSPEPSVIFLSENFRCGKPIIDFTNEVFKTVFGSGKRIPYTKNDELVFGKAADAREDVPVKLTVFPGGKVEDEAEYAVTEIKKLLKDGVKDDGGRIELSDIAVICEKSSTCAAVEKVFSDNGLSCVNTADRSFFDAPEVLLAISILTAIDNPMLDVPLAAAMKSPVFGFTLDELVKIRKTRENEPLYSALCAYADETDNYKCKRFMNLLSNLRRKSRTMPTDKFIRLFYRETSITSVIYNKRDKGDPADKKSNLMMLYELARRYEADAFKGLYGFISYCGEMIEKGQSFKTASDHSGKITVQTIHGSKGLEYPVCFIIGAASAFNTDYNKDAVVTDRVLGAGIRIKTPDDRIETGPLYRAAVMKKDDDNVADRACIFYVALTRAKKYLYITASPAKEPVFSSGYGKSCLDCRSFLDFLTASLDGNGGSYEYNCVYKDDDGENAENENVIGEGACDGVISDEEFSELERIYNYEYPYKEASELPKKASVSALYPAYLDPDEEVIDLAAEAEPVPLILPDYTEKEAERTAAAAGTSTHLFMQFCDFDNAEKDAVKEAERLVSLGFIRETDKELISYGEVSEFFKSPLYKRMRAAKESGRLFCREYRFNIELDAADFTEDEQRKKALLNETLLVQGVIDCFFEEEDGKITVVDYKTDRVSYNAVDEFRERHRRQLGYYKTATERITLKTVGKCELYSFCLGRSVIL